MALWGWCIVCPKVLFQFLLGVNAHTFGVCTWQFAQVFCCHCSNVSHCCGVVSVCQRDLLYPSTPSLKCSCWYLQSCLMAGELADLPPPWKDCKESHKVGSFMAFISVYPFALCSPRTQEWVVLYGQFVLGAFLRSIEHCVFHLCTGPLVWTPVEVQYSWGHLPWNKACLHDIL